MCEAIEDLTVSNKNASNLGEVKLFADTMPDTIISFAQGCDLNIRG